MRQTMYIQSLESTDVLFDPDFHPGVADQNLCQPFFLVIFQMIRQYSSDLGHQKHRIIILPLILLDLVKDRRRVVGCRWVVLAHTGLRVVPTHPRQRVVMRLVPRLVVVLVVTVVVLWPVAH